MPKTLDERFHSIDSFEGGMQRYTSRFLNAKNEVNLAKNADFQAILGAISKALGYSKLGNTVNSGAAILGCGALNSSAGSDKLVAFSGTDAYVYNSGTGAYDAQGRSYTASQKYETVSFLDMLFKWSGISDVPETYNGSTWSQVTNVTDAPKGKYPIIDKQRIYIFNINVPVGGSFPSRVWYCDLPKNNAITWGFESGTDLATTANDDTVTSAGGAFVTRNIKVGDPFFITTGSDVGEYVVKEVVSNTEITLTTNLTTTASNIQFWVGGNYIDVERDNSDVGMGVGKNSDRVLFYKRHSVHRFLKTNDVTTDSLIPIKGVPGTTSHRSIVSIRDWTFHYADSGIWRIDASGGILISAKMQEIIDGIAAASLDDIVGWSVGDRILKMFVGDVSNAVTGLTINKCVICYDTFTDIFWTEELADTINCATKWVTGSQKLNFIFSSDGEVFQTESGNAQNTADFEFSVESWPVFPLGPEYTMTFTRWRIYGQNLRDVGVEYKLWYEDGEIDEDWRSLDIIHQTSNEIEAAIKEGENRAVGYFLRFSEMSSTNRPAIERVVDFFTDPLLR